MSMTQGQVVNVVYNTTQGSFSWTGSALDLFDDQSCQD